MLKDKPWLLYICELGHKGPFTVLIIFFIGPKYSKVARGMLYMFTVTDPFSGKHWPINSSDSEGSTALRVFDDYVMLDTARVSVTLCLQEAELLYVV